MSSDFTIQSIFLSEASNFPLTKPDFVNPNWISYKLDWAYLNLSHSLDANVLDMQVTLPLDSYLLLSFSKDEYKENEPSQMKDVI